jgi:hypothetical protein
MSVILRTTIIGLLATACGDSVPEHAVAGAPIRRACEAPAPVDEPVPTRLSRLIGAAETRGFSRIDTRGRSAPLVHVADPCAGDWGWMFDAAHPPLSAWSTSLSVPDYSNLVALELWRYANAAEAAASVAAIEADSPEVRSNYEIHLKGLHEFWLEGEYVYFYYLRGISFVDECLALEQALLEVAPAVRRAVAPGNCGPPR